MPILPVVFEDDYLLVIDKPAGLVVAPADSHKGKTLAEILIEKFNINLDRGGIVHRLDKDTSGLLVVAKTLESFEKLQNQFKQRTVKKQYLALVHGFLNEPKEVDVPIERNPGNREKFTVLQGGRQAVTKFEPIQRLEISSQRLVEIFAGFSKIQFRKLYAMSYTLFTLIRCLPLTGRTHQIRVHLKYIGLPIVSDEKYGGRKTVRLDKRWCPRQFLHAARIEFSHPVTGNKMSFDSPLPEDLSHTLGCLKSV